MPHKRAKLSARQAERAKRGSDLAPTATVPLTQESIPKSIARVLQAEAVRKAHGEKRARGEDAQDGVNGDHSAKRRKKDVEQHKKSVEIKHGESIPQFNRRVEEEMRAPVAEAMQMSRAVTKKARRLDAKAKAEKIAAAQVKSKPAAAANDVAKSEHVKTVSAPARNTKTEFDKAAIRTRLNDVVQEPPTLTKLPRGASKLQADKRSTDKTNGVVSMAQKQMMELERENAIRRYRELRERRATGGRV
ncbi:hypothetical protein BU17DRAFT_85089 [Hysterangium stoloniferum]|nr:hypothetical protein BU17DRAFT_85089 [Hysterangium stoloniferum]